MLRVLLCLASALLLLIPASAQEKAVFKSGIQTIVLHATVRSDDGRMVPDLSAEDFEVRDEGQPVQISVFSSDPQPITVALLLDMSGSMIGHFLRVREATRFFVDAIQPGDRVRIGTFGDEVAISPVLTGDKTVLHQLIAHELWPGGGTPLWNAICAGMRSLSQETGRRVILTLTDGAGSLIVVEAESLGAVWELVGRDPYVTNGIFERVEVHPFMQVFPKAG
jgi:hypothetical protein